MYNKCVKRLLDILLSAVGIVVLSIPMLVVALMIKLDSPGPVFFVQKRVGLHKQLFSILKFRSMPISVPHDLPTRQFDAEDTLSTWQKFIRKSSIDELPQMFNILVGQMSIIGPRPVVWKEQDLIMERDKYGANDIRPGLTGWAQINGRDELPVDVKARYDGEYVEQMSFVFDCKCFWGTIGKVLRQEGIIEGSAGAHSERKRDTIAR